jgi:hypothetical protein
VNPPDRTTVIETLPVAFRADGIGEPVAVR